MNVWAIITITLILSAFFSGMEIAFVSANKLKLEVDKQKGSLSARLMIYFAAIPSKLIGALLLGNNIALVLYGMAMTHLMDPIFARYLPEQWLSESLVLLFETIISTFIILLLAEFLPKALFRIHSNRILRFFAVPVTIFYYLFYPVIQLYLAISAFIIRYIFGVHLGKEKIQYNYFDLDHYLQQYTSDNDKENEFKQELQMFQNTIEFRNIKIRECMVPRTEIIAVRETESVEMLRNAFVANGLSRVIIFRNTIDNIVGYCHAFDLFKKPATIAEVVREISFIPETMPARDVLSNFIEKSLNIAVVVDEFGGTAGLVTMEDIMEEIFGEIEDEYDEEMMTEEKVGDNAYVFSSRLEIDYLNEKYNLSLPVSEEYETLAGLLIHYAEDIPDIREKIDIEDYSFVILSSSEKKIDKVKLTIHTN